MQGHATDAADPVDVVLVDAQDREIGRAAKGPTHLHPVPLHRAISVFLFDAQDRLLLTRRSPGKATWPGVWSNACCTHPLPGEAPADAAARRVAQELGVSPALRFVFSFSYEADWDGIHGEHELDHVFMGRCVAALDPDPSEIDAVRWVDATTLAALRAEDTSALTPWFRLAIDRVLAAWHAGSVPPQA